MGFPRKRSGSKEKHAAKLRWGSSHRKNLPLKGNGFFLEQHNNQATFTDLHVMSQISKERAL